jgi:hypothetical protein
MLRAVVVLEIDAVATENPIMNDRCVPVETSGSGTARGQAPSATARQPEKTQPRSGFICDEYVARDCKLSGSGNG